MSAGEQRAGNELTLAQALALGLLHGPSELLPISSSAHATLVPWLLDWPYAELDPRLRKGFEVALHAGTAAALLARPPWRSAGRSDRRRPGAAALACAIAPPTLAGYVLGERIERRLGTPPTIAAGLLAGAAAMAAAELRRRPSNSDRSSAASAGARDGLAVGVAQAFALIPGVSRSGLAAAAARWRGFDRAQADRLSWQAGLPVIAGAALLQGARLARGGVQREHRRALAVGAAGALLSTELSGRLLAADLRLRLLPATIVYRAALAALVIRRVRDNKKEKRQPRPDTP